MHQEQTIEVEDFFYILSMCFFCLLLLLLLFFFCFVFLGRGVFLFYFRTNMFKVLNLVC